MTKPVFSPAMLRLFLMGHAERFALEHDDMPREKALRAFRSYVRHTAGVTAAIIDQAFAGRLCNASARVRLWGFLGLIPADLGVMLLDNGKQEAAN
ncbi:MAG: hypothetical protein BGP07_03220 [Rhizobiales bacterium 63-22]|nr:MAG: hypothetical protein BGP07_03220 [Rhizobiales bacterium 63-22]